MTQRIRNLSLSVLLIALCFGLPTTSFANELNTSSSQVTSCFGVADIYGDGAVSMEWVDAEGDKCMIPAYTCDDGKGGSKAVTKSSKCSECALTHHCEGCCGSLTSTPSAKTRCCANECGTTC